MPPVEAATIRFGSSGRLVITLAKATAPTPPGMLVVCTVPSTKPSSARSLPTVRQVKSQPPPGLAGAMHSTPEGVKAAAGRATTAAAAAPRRRLKIMRRVLPDCARWVFRGTCEAAPLRRTIRPMATRVKPCKAQDPAAPEPRAQEDPPMTPGPVPEGSEITVVEVGPRDGFQIEKGFIPTDAKISVVNALLA